ncbi:hypothetical protein BPOR_1167g00020 [Botrytis porri]|uniref:Actin-like ATPase domain-containing protein n=1 Tax=Botrytis porri TaxID=87229 RepID=A0A4Z1KB71_9HELO|nr:hypothetical protein BPOR_1167g00020 [Botrytis porri]
MAWLMVTFLDKVYLKSQIIQDDCAVQLLKFFEEDTPSKSINTPLDHKFFISILLDSTRRDFQAHGKETTSVAMAPFDDNAPDIIVGIDFGQTYTAIPPKVSKNGPDYLPIPRKQKLQPRLHIHAMRMVDMKPCGVSCDPDDEYHDSGGGVRDMPETVDEAKYFVTGYPHQIYMHVKLCIEAITGSWKEKRIEFVFSLPTTWDAQDTVNRFIEAMSAAGFISQNPDKHSAKLELSEAEAAAVYFVTNSEIELEKGDIILICDAGGGTTDLGLVKVADPSPERPALKQVAKVKGVGTGSTVIDRAFERLVPNRLDAYPDIELPDNPAHKLARSSSFQSIQHNFGTTSGNHAIFEIQHPFDVQISGIIRKIDKQLDWMQTHRSHDDVKFLVLSGGLGGSQYVKTKIEEYFYRNPRQIAHRI